MSRFKPKEEFAVEAQTNKIPVYNSPYAPQQPQYQAEQSPQMPYWPNDFPKPVVGMEREGLLLRRTGSVIKRPEDCEFIPEGLEAVRMLRLKGHKLMIIFQQPEIAKGNLTAEEVELVNQHMMQAFGQAGILSIDGMYYSTSDFRQDMYAKPNTGMFKRAQNENPHIVWKHGWYVGDQIEDLKAADKIGATPVLVRTDVGMETEQKLNSFSNRQLKKKTVVYDSLLEFASSL